MRSWYLAILLIVTGLSMLGQSITNTFSLRNYAYVSEQRVTRTKSNVTYRADLVNNGGALALVSATLSSLNPASFHIVAGENTLMFGPVPANSQTTSSNTFTILVDRLIPFDFANLQVTFQTGPLQPPIANAGPNQKVMVGATVTLNGSGSTNPVGVGTLTYSWAFAARPAPSNATLLNPTSVMPTLLADVGGNYVIELVVSNGTLTSAPSSVTVTTDNGGPTAVPMGPSTTPVGSTAHLDGSHSSDPGGNPLTYFWKLASVPSGSAAILTGPNTALPTFAADKSGAYTVQLMVTNNFGEASPPANVAVNATCALPMANPGPPQKVNAGDKVQLNGSASTDPNGLPLSYAWSLVTKPPGSIATLSNPTIASPTFVADIPNAAWIVQLIVSNPCSSSVAVTMMVSTSAAAPTSNAGPNQSVAHNTTVQLNGSGIDPQGLTLTFSWSFASVPNGSSAAFSSSTIANPTFLADKPGSYVAQLKVTNSAGLSGTASVTTVATDAPPVANPGADQSVVVGTTVKLNGSTSSDPDSDPITAYAWTLSKPAGSGTALSGANTAQASFTADIAGTYLAQLVVSDAYASSPPASMTITAFMPATPSSVTYTYDGQGRLKATKYTGSAGSVTVTYSYDPAGNRTSVVAK